MMDARTVIAIVNKATTYEEFKWAAREVRDCIREANEPEMSFALLATLSLRGHAIIKDLPRRDFKYANHISNQVMLTIAAEPMRRVE